LHPGHAAVGIEARNGVGAVIEKLAACHTPRRIERTLRNKMIEIFEIIIIDGIDNHTAITVDD